MRKAKDACQIIFGKGVGMYLDGPTVVVAELGYLTPWQRARMAIVRHKCDTPRCVNPHHLEYGTVSDNMQDMVKRGRRAKRDQSGENNGAAKLTAADVEEIRGLIDTGQTNTAIAERFGVTHSLISRIRRGRRWAA